MALTYEQMKKAEALALKISRASGFVPVAVVKGAKMGWFDFHPEVWRVVRSIEGLPPEDVYITGILATPGAQL